MARMIMPEQSPVGEAAERSRLALRRAVMDVAVSLGRAGLSDGHAYRRRRSGPMLSWLPLTRKRDLGPDDLAVIRLDGTVAEGDLAELRPGGCRSGRGPARLPGMVADLTAERAGTQAVWLVGHGVLAFGSGHGAEAADAPDRAPGPRPRVFPARGGEGHQRQVEDPGGKSVTGRGNQQYPRAGPGAAGSVRSRCPARAKRADPGWVLDRGIIARLLLDGYVSDWYGPGRN